MSELPINQIIQGDCLDVMKDWPDGCVDLCLTDPPWNLDYFADDDKPWREYAKWLQRVRNMTQRKSAAVFIFQSTKAVSHVAHLFHDWRMFANPKSFCQLIKGQMSNAFDVGFLSDHKTNFTGDTGFRNWHIANNSSGVNACRGLGHPTPRPLDTMLYLIGMFSHDIILDPFCGSGTTCVAAKMLGRNYIGIDISEEYCNIARKRLEAVDTGVPVKERDNGQIPLFGAK